MVYKYFQLQSNSMLTPICLSVLLSFPVFNRNYSEATPLLRPNWPVVVISCTVEYKQLADSNVDGVVQLAETYKVHTFLSTLKHNILSLYTKSNNGKEVQTHCRQTKSKKMDRLSPTTKPKNGPIVANPNAM